MLSKVESKVLVKLWEVLDLITDLGEGESTTLLELGLFKEAEIAIAAFLLPKKVGKKEEVKVKKEKEVKEEVKVKKETPKKAEKEVETLSEEEVVEAVLERAEEETKKSEMEFPELQQAFFKLCEVSGNTKKALGIIKKLGVKKLSDIPVEKRREAYDVVVAETENYESEVE